jgi:hypothetical protein
MDLLGPPGRYVLGESNRRCSATNRNGERCGRWAAVGAFVCVNHGAGAPQVKAAAERRHHALIASLVEPALERAVRILEVKDDCSHCGRSDNDAIAAQTIRTVLHYAGLDPALKVEVSGGDDGPAAWGPYLTDEQLAQIMAWIGEAKARMAAADSGYVEATVVSEIPANTGVIPSTQVVATCAPGSEDDDDA